MPLQPADRVYPQVPPEPRHAPPPMAPPPVPTPRPPPRVLDELALQNTTLYFTYASNLYVALMAQRCPGSIFRGPGTLRDYIPTTSPMGVVTIRPAPRNRGHHVEGLVYSVPKQEMDAIRALAPDTARRRERVIFKPYLPLSGHPVQGLAAILASETGGRKELSRGQGSQPVGEPLEEDAVLWTTEPFRVQADGRFAAYPDKLVTLALGNAITLGVPTSFYVEQIIPHVGVPLNLRLRGTWSNTVVPVQGGVARPVAYDRTPTPSAAPSGMSATPGRHTTGRAAALGQLNSSSPYNPVARSAPLGTVDHTMGFSTPAPSAAPSEMLVAQGSIPPGTINPIMGFGTPAMPIVAPARIPAIHELYAADIGADLGQGNPLNPYNSVAQGSVAQGSAPPATVDPATGFGTPAPSAAPSAGPLAAHGGITSIHGLYVADGGANMGQANPSNPYSSAAQGAAPPGTVDSATGFGARAPDGALATPSFYNADGGATSGLVPPATFNPAMGFGAPVPDGTLAIPGFYNADSGAASGLVTPGTFNPWTMGWGTPVPEGAAATSSLNNVDSGAPLSQPSFSNRQSSSHHGTMNPPPGFSTPAPPTAPDRTQATPGLYNADGSGALSQPSFSNPDGSVPHANINPTIVDSTTAPSMAPDVDLTTPGVYSADSGGASSQPSFFPQGSVPPETIDPAMLSTLGPSTAHGDFALGQQGFSNPHHSVPPGTIDHTMAPSTPEPSAAPGGMLATPSLNTADSGIGMGQPSSSRPYGSTPSESIGRKPKGKTVNQQASSLSAPDSVFPTPNRSTAPGRISNTPSTYTPQRDVFSNPQGAVPTGSNRPKVDVNMVGRRTMSSTALGKMVSRQPSKPAIQKRVSSQSSSSKALDRALSTPGHSGAPSGVFTDPGGNAATQARHAITHPAPPAPGARREAGALTEPSVASHAGPASASNPPMPPPIASMASVRRRIRDICLNMGIQLIIPTLQNADCFYFDDESKDAIYTIQAMKQLAWTETLADFKVVDVTYDRLLANEVALNTLQEVLEAAMKVKAEDLTVIAMKHWLKVQEGGDENQRSFKCLVSDDGLLRLECVLGEGKGEVLI